jgi:hypothetical protein
MANNYAKARFNCPEHSGATERIREALKRAREPMSVHGLQCATGLAVDKIRSCLADMVKRTGGVVSSQGKKGTVYALYSPAVARVADGMDHRAGRITIPQYRWGASRLG